MAKIVIDARESGTTTGRYVDKLLEYAHSLKPDHDIVVITKPSRLTHLSRALPNFELVETPYQEFSFGEQLGFAKQLTNLRPDLIHFVMPQQPILYRGAAVTTMHDLTTIRFQNPQKNPFVFWIKQRAYKLVVKRVAHKSRKLIATSRFTANDVARYAHIAESKIQVIYEAADKITEPARPVPRLQQTNFIFYVGRPLPHKNLNRLIDAFALVKQDLPKLQLVLAGKKDVLFERLAAYAHKKGVPDVVFPGFVSEGELRWLYEHAEAYVFPSLSEGFGLPGLEAMAHGCAVISSKATCLPEIYGSAAYYFDPYDVAEMAHAIKTVLEKTKLRDDLIKKGTQKVGEYSWQKMAEQTLAVYESALSG